MRKRKNPAAAATAGGARNAVLGGQRFDSRPVPVHEQGPRLIQLIAHMGAGAWLVDLGGPKLEVAQAYVLERGWRSGALVCMCDICTGAMQ